VGAYRPGSDARVDEAVALYPQLTKFLQQSITEAVSLSDSIEELESLRSMEIVAPQQNQGLPAASSQQALPAGANPYAK
jgi:hypothetical protein